MGNDLVRREVVTTVRTNLVQGPPGAVGPRGLRGLQGVPFGRTADSYVQPAVDSSVTVTIDDVSWLVPLSFVVIEGGGIYQVGAIDTQASTAVMLLAYGFNPEGTSIETFRVITASGPPGVQGLPGATGPIGPTGPAGSGGGGGSLPNPPTNIGAVIFDTNNETWRNPTQDDIKPGYALAYSLSGAGPFEVGTTNTAAGAWSITGALGTASVTFTDTDGNTVNVLSTPSFTTPSYHKTAPATITTTVTAVATGGSPTKAVNHTISIESAMFYGAHTTGGSSQADAEALTKLLISGRSNNNLTATVGVGKSFVVYAPKSVFSTAPNFFFGAVPTDFNVTSITFTRNGVAQDWWVCEAAEDDTGATTVSTT